MKNKKAFFLVITLLIALFMASAAIASDNIEIIIRTKKQIHFISNHIELGDVHHELIQNDHLNFGIAVYLPFYVKSKGRTHKLETLIQYCKNNKLPIFLYDFPGNFDTKLASEILGTDVSGCEPMVCAGALFLENDPIINCVADWSKTKKRLRKMVLFGLKTMREF